MADDYEAELAAAIEKNAPDLCLSSPGFRHCGCWPEAPCCGCGLDGT